MRRLVWFSIGFATACLLGAILYQQWLVLVDVIALIIAAILVVVHKKNGSCLLPLLIVLGIGTGLCWFCAYDYLFVTIPRAADGKQFNVCIEATEYSYETDYGSSVEGRVVFNDKTYAVKAYLHTKEQVSPGDTVSGMFRFRLTTNGGVDNPTSHRTEGIFLLAYPIGSSQIQHTDDTSWRHYPAVWRHRLLTRIKELLPGDAGGFAAALLLGDRSGITYEMDTSFKVSGISHVIAVSGLHVSILFGLVYTLLARRRWLSCTIGIPVLVLFAAIAGFTPSITRACIMQSLMLLAMVLDREYDGPTALAFAVLMMLAVNPLTILSVSFQLSVCCMMGIFLFSEKIRQYLRQIAKRHIYKEQKLMNRLWQGITASVSVSLSATAMTMPLVAFYFGCISAFSVLTNLLTLWVISFIFYGLIVCLAVSAVSLVLGKLLGVIVYVPIVFVLKTAELVSKLPMSAMYTSNPYGVVWLLGIYIMLAFFLLQRKKQPKLLVVSVIFTFLLAQMFSWFEPLNDDFRVTMLDVGQGQSILLQSEGKTFLVDCGGDDSEDAADTTVEALLSQGICRLDGIIITHFDKDHMGGVVHLLSRIQTDRLILPDVENEDQVGATLASATDAAVAYIRDDTLYTFGKAEMTLFAPISSESDNESCICILFQWENCGILITGDRGISGEMALLQTHTIPQVDVLVAGHHGSSGSTSTALLEATAPRIALISVGEDNRYGHPAGAVLQRLMDAGCKIYRTDIHGTIIFRR